MNVSWPEIERIEPENRIAAEARQFFRAVGANDSFSVEISWFYFTNLLIVQLSQHLDGDSRWEPKRNSQENASGSGRWIDFLAGTPPLIYEPVWIHLRDDAYCYIDDPLIGMEPFQFELELNRSDGAFRGYTFNFGNACHFSTNQQTLAQEQVGHCWAFSFQRGSSKANQNWYFSQSRPVHIEQSALADIGDFLLQWDRWLASLGRQWIRANEAEDSIAENVTFMYFQSILLDFLRYSLRSNEQWNSNQLREVKGFVGRFPEFSTAHTLHIRDEVIVQIKDVRGGILSFTEPFEFDIYLCPSTGIFLGSMMRFGDATAEKPMPDLTKRPNEGGWLLTLRRPGHESL